MPDYPHRFDVEKAVATAIGDRFAVAREIADGGSPVHWPTLRDQIRDGITPATEGAYLGVLALMLAGDEIPALGRLAANRWATATATATADGIVAKSAAKLSTGAAPATVFAPSRAESIAITNTTRTITAAETEARRIGARISGAGSEPPKLPTSLERPRGGDGFDLPGPLTVPDGLLAIWWTERDGRVCEICRPLHRKPYSEWSNVAPAGPPAHIRCRCWLEYVAVEAYAYNPISGRLLIASRRFLSRHSGQFAP